MDLSKNDSSDFNQSEADQLYQLLMDLNRNGITDICINPKSLLSSEVDTIAAINRSASIEKEAQDILRLFTNAPVTPVLRGVNTLSNLNERALVPRSNINYLKRRECYKINIWKEDHLITSIVNDTVKGVPMHYIDLKIEKNGAFIITGLDNVTDEIRNKIQELCSMIAIENANNSKKDEDQGVQLREITDDSENEQVIEVPLHDGILKFSSKQNPLDILSEIYCTEDTSDNKKIFKVPILGDFLVSPEDDPVQAFKAMTGHDLSEFYKTPGNSDLTIEEIPDNTDEKENKIKAKKTRSQRHKKNKQKKRKSKKRK